MPSATESEAPKFIYEKQKICISRRAAHIYSVLIKSPKFIYGDSSCLLPPASLTESVPLFNFAIYDGFFVAGLGILMLATLTFLGIKSLQTMNAFKTFLGSCINGIGLTHFTN